MDESSAQTRWVFRFQTYDPAHHCYVDSDHYGTRTAIEARHGLLRGVGIPVPSETIGGDGLIHGDKVAELLQSRSASSQRG